MTVGELITRLHAFPEGKDVTIEEMLKIINEIYVDNYRRKPQKCSI